jgi:circadian clock protein KaiC
MKRIPSGIKGLDPLVGGGFLNEHSILICGDPGTGKTIFGLQFLYKGITESNENGLYVSIEDTPKKMKYYAGEFGWDLDKLEKSKKICFLTIPIDQKGYLLVDAILEKAKEINAKRIVVDSLSALSVNARMYSLPLRDQLDPTGTIKGKILHTAGYTPFEDITQFTYLFINRLRELNSCVLFLTDTQEGPPTLTKDGVSEFASDGVILLKLHDTSKNVNRTLSVKKMRGSKIIPGMNMLKFTDTGLEVGEFKAFY